MSHDVVRRRVSRAHPVVNAASSQDDGALVLMDEFEDVTKEFLAAKSLRVTNLSAGQLPASARPAPREKTNENVASLGTFRVPTHSAWFRWEDAHAVEEKALPELFTPQALDDDGREKYIECRNAMMRKFRDTGRNITLNEANSALKSESRVDNDTAGRIFSFLEDWGLLNWKFATEPKCSTSRDARRGMPPNRHRRRRIVARRRGRCVEGDRFTVVRFRPHSCDDALGTSRPRARERRASARCLGSLSANPSTRSSPRIERFEA